MNKRITQLGVAALFAILFYTGATAQTASYRYLSARLFVSAPTSVRGFKNNNPANDGTGAAGQWGRKIDTVYVNVPLVKTSDPLACTSITSLTGKFALILRADCEFGFKALQAQNQGAIGVLLANNIYGEGPVGMGAGAVGASVTIPVLSISREDYDALSSAMQANTVTIGLSPWGFNNAEDVALIPASTAGFHARAIPLVQMAADNGNPLPYRVYTAGLLAQTGTDSVSGLKLKQTVSFTPTGGSPTVLIQDSTFIAGAFNPIDSVFQTFSSNANDVHTAVKGQFTMTNTVSMNTTDLLPDDNTIIETVDVTDSVFSKVRLSPVTGKPIANIGYRPGGVTSPYSWGPMFFVAKGGYIPSSVDFTVATNSAGGSLANDGTVNVYLYKWSPGVSDDTTISPNEIKMVGLGAYNFTAVDSNFDIFNAKLQDAVMPNKVLRVDNDSWYWVVVEATSTLFIGCDNDISYYNRSRASEFLPASSDPEIEFWAPWVPTTGLMLEGNTVDTIRGYPFAVARTGTADDLFFPNTVGLAPAVALRMSLNKPTGIYNGTPNPISSFDVFPNPAVSSVTARIAFSSPSRTEVKLVDVLGRTIESKKFDSVQSSEVTFDIHTLAPGSYHVIINTPGFSSARPVVIAR